MLMNNYFEHYKLRKTNNKGKIGASASEIFDFQGYFSQFGADHRSFLQEAQHSMVYLSYYFHINFYYSFL